MMLGAAFTVTAVLWILGAAPLGSTPLSDLRRQAPELHREIAALPAYEEGAEPYQRVARLYLDSSNAEVREAFAIVLSGHNLARSLRESGTAERCIAPSYDIPSHNTALEMLACLAGRDLLPPNDLLALAVCISNSFLITFGDGEVRAAALDKAERWLAFLRQTAQLQADAGNVPLERYPLEALLPMCSLWAAHFHGPTTRDPAFREEHFGDLAARPIDMIRFDWSTIGLENVYALQERFRERGAFALKPRRAVRAAMDFLYRDGASLFRYPAHPRLDPTTGVPHTYMVFRGIEALNSNWNNPNYMIESILAGQAFYGWCTDIRDAMPFVAAALGLATVHTGWGILRGEKEISHYFVLFYLPDEGVWIRDSRDNVSTPQDESIPIYLKAAQLRLGEYWKDLYLIPYSCDITYNAMVPASVVSALYDAGLPSAVLKKIAFDRMPLGTDAMIALAADREGDGLSDWMESEVYGTRADSADTDGDGFADAWELRNGFGAADSSSPARYRLMAVDGLAETLTTPLSGTLVDARGDSAVEGGNDIASMEALVRDGVAYIRVRFHHQQAEVVTHTFRIRKEDATNYWYQTRPAAWAHVAEFKDGQDLSLWSASAVDPEVVDIAVRDVLEAAFPLADFGLDGSFQISYIVGAQREGAELWNADETDLMAVYVADPLVRLDGDATDMLAALAMRSVADPQGDVEADHNRFDIAAVHVGRLDGDLALAATFHGDIRDNGRVNVTVHARLPSSGTNYWIQWWGNYLVFVGTFRDGAPFETWDRIALDDPRLAGARLARARDLELLVPGALLPSGRVDMRLFLGGRKGQDAVWNADSSDWINAGDQ